MSLDDSLEWGGSLAKQIREAKSRQAQEKADRTREAFTALCQEHGCPAPVPEYRFHGERLWRWDYAWPEQLVALEVDGGVWTGGKHGRGSGIVKDHEKRNAGAQLGWRLLLATPKQLLRKETVAMVARTLRTGAPG
jgi:hypothetical protein